MDIIDNEIKIDDVNIYYRTAGDPKKQPLVFLHGWPMNFYGYPSLRVNDVIENLAQHFYVIAPEHPGAFHSDPPQRPWNTTDYAGYVDKLMDHRQIKKAIIMGQSTGGGIAATYAALHPEKTVLTVLVDAVTTYQARTTSTFIKYNILFPIYALFLKLPIIPFSFKASLVHLAHQAPKNNLKKDTIYRYGNVISINKLSVDYKNIKVPIILVWGKDDESTSIKWVYQIQQDVKSAKLIVLNGGHTILYQEPEYVVNELMKNITI